MSRVKALLFDGEYIFREQVRVKKYLFDFIFICTITIVYIIMWLKLQQLKYVLDYFSYCGNIIIIIAILQEISAKTV